MIALEVADLVLIASRTLGLDTGQVLDLLDPAAAEHALAQARPGSEPADPATGAAALLHALVRQRPLRRGNQQVALAAMLQFLALNGQDMDPDPPGPVAAMVTQLAAGTLDTKDVADWLAPRLRPSGRAAARVKEAPMRPRPALPLVGRIKGPRCGPGPRACSRGSPTAPGGSSSWRRTRPGNSVTVPSVPSISCSACSPRERASPPWRWSRWASRWRKRGTGSRRSPAAARARPRATSRSRRAAKKVLEGSLREALQLGHTYIGTEHLLLSLLAEGDGIAAQVLAGRGAGYALVRERVVALLTGRHEQADPKTRLVRLPVPAGLADVTEQLRQVQRQKTAAFEAGDHDSAAALRDREKQLRAEKLRLEQEWAAGVDVRAVIAENQRVHRELDRLRGLLRQHGIEPDGGTARTA